MNCVFSCRVSAASCVRHVTVSRVPAVMTTRVSHGHAGMVLAVCAMSRAVAVTVRRCSMEMSVSSTISRIRLRTRPPPPARAAPSATAATRLAMDSAMYAVYVFHSTVTLVMTLVLLLFCIVYLTIQSLGLLVR